MNALGNAAYVAYKVVCSSANEPTDVGNPFHCAALYGHLYQMGMLSFQAWLFHNSTACQPCANCYCRYWSSVSVSGFECEYEWSVAAVFPPSPSKGEVTLIPRIRQNQLSTLKWII